MSTIQFIGTNPTDLITELKNSLIPELKAQLSAQFHPKEPTEYLTRSETCRSLKINTSTLHRWRQKKIITAYSIEGKVLFKRKEIDDLINKSALK